MIQDYGHWTIKGGIPEDAIGFIYKVTNNKTNRKYIGKKLLKFKKTQKPLKGNKNKRRSLIDSKWREYTGSSTALNEDIKNIGKENFTFEILCWANCKSELNYAELREIITVDALHDPLYYNEFVGGKIRIRKPQP